MATIAPGPPDSSGFGFMDWLLPGIGIPLGSSSDPEPLPEPDPPAAADEVAGQGCKLDEAGAKMRVLKAILSEELANIAKPPGARSGSDVFVGEHKDVNQQFLSDCHRSLVRIANVGFVQDHGEDEDVFADRLITHLRWCLRADGAGAERQALLMRLVTTLLSQAGMALLTMACSGAQLALSGGQRRSVYQLQPGGHHSWKIKLDFFASCFQEVLQPEVGFGGPISCRPTSSIKRGCALAVELEDTSPGGIRLDVLELSESTVILDPQGDEISFSPTRPFPLLEVRDFEAWEGRTLLLPAAVQAEDIVSAWYGHPEYPDQRYDVAEKVRACISGLEPRAEDGRLELPISNRIFGDPSWFVWKRLGVTVRVPRFGNLE